MTACFLTLPGSVPFPTSIWIYSFLCLCYSILFHPDPTVSSFPAGSKSWGQSWVFSGTSCSRSLRSCCGPLPHLLAAQAESLPVLATLFHLALLTFLCVLTVYVGVFQFSGPPALLLPSTSAHSDTLLGLWMVWVCPYLLVFCCSRGYLVSKHLVLLYEVLCFYGGIQRALKTRLPQSSVSMACGKFWKLMSHNCRLFE